MKLVYGLGLLLALGVGVALGGVTPRFEKIYEQELKGNRFSDYFEVYHDKDTGQEIVCVLAAGHYDSSSCYLTGRKW